MRHLITDPQDIYAGEPTQEDWDDYRDYLDSLGWEEEQEEMAFEEANRELIAVDCPI